MVNGVYDPYGSLAKWMDAERFEVGQLVYVTGGVYSDYGVSCVARVVKPFRCADWVLVRRSSWEQPQIDLGELVAQGYLEELPARELWIGA